MRSLHYKLFSRYALLLLAIIVSFMAALYILLGNSFRDSAVSELQADCDNLGTLLDTQMEQMNDLSKRIVSSRQLGSLFLRDIYTDDPADYDQKMLFSDTLFDIIKLSFDNMALNILDVSGRHVHVGNVSTFRILDREELAGTEWFPAVLEAYGRPVILPTHEPDFADRPTPVISFCRAFSPGGSREETAVLELQLQYSYLQQKIRHALYDSEGRKKVYIYDDKGALVYPWEAPPEAETEREIKAALDFAAEKEGAYIFRPESPSSWLYGCKRIGQADWTVAVAASERELLASFYQFQLLVLLASVLVLALALAITYRIASKLSAPLRELAVAASALTLDKLDAADFSGGKSDIRELDSLYCSFGQMQKNLQESLDEVIKVHTMATEAKMLALQSQMNPHFLYNTLASISALAEDGEDEKVVQSCSDLSLLLRYISSNSSDRVMMWQEVAHTSSYMQLIKNKYEERLQFTMQIDGEICGLPVPKLIIQPLVENCVKYALEVRPPWQIAVRGYAEGDGWRIRVSDNGPGFSAEYLDFFAGKRAEIRPGEPLPRLSVNGMGLLNLYTRLLLLYGEALFFSLENLPGGGACVTVGGPLPEKTGDEDDGDRKDKDRDC